MPAVNPLVEEAFEFQLNFVKSGGVSVALSMLTKNNFLPNADLQTRRSAYHVVLKMCKLLLTAVGHAQVGDLFHLVFNLYFQRHIYPGLSDYTLMDVTDVDSLLPKFVLGSGRG